MKILLKLWWCWLSETTDNGEGRWDGGSVVLWAGLLVVRQVEEGGTNEDLDDEDLDDDDDDDDNAMDVMSDKDDAIVHATVGWHPPPRPSSPGGRDEAPVVLRLPRAVPPSSSSRREKKLRRRGERAMGTGDDDEGGRRRGGKEGGRASGRANLVAAAPIANEVLVANLSKIANKRCTAPVVIAPCAS